MSLHVDAAFGRHDEPDARRFAVDRQAHIGFVHEVDALFDAEAMDRFAVQRAPVELRDDARGVVARGGAFDAAGLAAAAGCDLRLDHQRTVRRLAGEHVAARRHEHAARNGNAVRRQQFLAVMLDQEHVCAPRSRRGP